MHDTSRGPDAERVVDDFLAGRLDRRGLITRLLGLGAALGGIHGLARVAQASAAAERPTFSAQTVDHIALSVTDVARSVEWYERHLGLRLTSRSSTSAFLGCPGGDFVALFEGSPPGLHHYSFGIQGYDQQEAVRRLREAGLTPKPRGDRMYFDDPDGIEVQISPV